MGWRSVGNDVGKDGDARTFDEARDPKARLILHGVGGEEGVLGAEAREGAVRVVEVVHRGTELPGPGEKVLEEARERLSIIQAHLVTCRNTLELGDCASSLRRGNGGDAERAVQAKARPEDRRARLALRGDGHPKAHHGGDFAPAG